MSPLKEQDAVIVKEAAAVAHLPPVFPTPHHRTISSNNTATATAAAATIIIAAAIAAAPSVVDEHPTVDVQEQDCRRQRGRVS